MYPSGSWRGFWDQAVYGRQLMQDLVLQFANGRVEGSGVDMVGPFTFEGTYDTDGTVTLIKRYPRHAVNYAGRYDGEGTVFGEWTIGGFLRGKFALTPERSSKPEEKRIVEIMPEESKGN